MRKAMRVGKRMDEKSGGPNKGNKEIRDGKVAVFFLSGKTGRGTERSKQSRTPENFRPTHFH